MDFNRIWTFLKQYAGELFLILCGAVLLFFPNSAVALVTKLMAWILIIAGVFRAIRNLEQKSTGFRGWIVPIACLLVGFYLTRNPLSITNLAGRILGLYLVVTGVQNIRHSTYGSARVLGIVSLIAGIVLFLLPEALVNTVLGFAGLVLVIIGVINLLDKLRHGNRITDGSDPNIIDADV